MRGALTKREQEVYTFVNAFIKAEHRSPSVTEIAERLFPRTKTGKLRLSMVSELLDSLETKGFLTHGRFGEYGYLIAPAPAEESPAHYTYVIGRLHANGRVEEVEPQGLTFTLDVRNPEEIFFLIAAQPLPELSVLEGDLLLFEHNRPIAGGDQVVFAVGEKHQPDPFFVARYMGIGDREAMEKISQLQGGDPSIVIDTQPHYPDTIKRLAAQEGATGGFLVRGLTRQAESTPEYQRFLQLARTRLGTVQFVASQIGLLRLTSHWQRTIRKAPD